MIGLVIVEVKSLRKERAARRMAGRASVQGLFNCINGLGLLAGNLLADVSYALVDPRIRTG